MKDKEYIDIFKMLDIKMKVMRRKKASLIAAITDICINNPTFEEANIKLDNIHLLKDLYDVINLIHQEMLDNNKTYQKIYYKTNQVQWKINYATNKNDIKARNKVRYEANKDAIKAKSRAYYLANRDKVRAKNKAYYEANKERIRLRNESKKKK